VKIEGSGFTVDIRSGLNPEQLADVAHALCKIAVDPYPPRPRDELRRVAIRAALHQFPGSPYRRARSLEDRYEAYLSSGWLRECDLESLPHPRTTARFCLHRLARLNEGRLAVLAHDLLHREFSTGMNCVLQLSRLEVAKPPGAQDACHKKWRLRHRR
jgi:hypothetical protein